MAGTTANNSWPYPESTDFVADGATAIENLADAIDISMPRGYMAHDTVASYTLTGSAVTVVNVSFTVPSARRFLVSLRYDIDNIQSGGRIVYVYIDQKIDAGSWTRLLSPRWFLSYATSDERSLSDFVTTTTSGAVTTYQVRAQFFKSSGTTGDVENVTLLVEDIGDN